MPIHVQELNDTNCKTYLLTAGGEAALVDPVRERLEHYRRVLSERGLALAMILETHTHADHLMLGRDAQEALGGARIVMHRESPSPVVDVHVSEGSELSLGGERLRVLETPGHTPDSVAYVLDGAVLTGDALLIGGSGRTDFPGGDAGAGYDSVQKLFALPDDTVVWPGHDYKGNTSSTIGREKTDNPRFAGKSREAYIALMANLGLPFPDRVQQVLQVNQSGFEADDVGGFPLVTDIAQIAQVDPRAVAEALARDEPPVILDVREPEEFVGELGHVEGALLVPMDALHRRLPKLAGYVDRDVIVVCRAGARSATATVLLQRAGFHRVRNLRGGMLAWAQAGLPTCR